MTIKNESIIRSSFALDGTRIFLIHDDSKSVFRIATRWSWLATFQTVWDGCDAFEALELLEGDLRSISRLLRTEINRVPRWVFIHRNRMGRINYLINSAERRLQGLRPQRCGTKGGVEKWIPANPSGN
jgi:hypothetical protein